MYNIFFNASLKFAFILLILFIHTEVYAKDTSLLSSKYTSIGEIVSKHLKGQKLSLVIDSNIPVIGEVILPENLSVSFTENGRFTKGKNGKLVIYADIEANPTKIFYNFNLGDVVFLSSSPMLYPQWWGAKGDGIHDDSYAINLSISAVTYFTSLKGEHHSLMALGGGSSIFFKRGTYAIKHSVVLRPLTKLIGNGSKLLYKGNSFEDVIRNANSSAKPFEILPAIYDSNGISIQDMIVDGSHIARSGVSLKRVTDSAFQGITIVNVAQDGLHLEQSQWNQFTNIVVSGSGRHGVCLAGSSDFGKRSNNNTFIRCKFEGSGRLSDGHGAYLINGHNNSFVGCTFQFGMESFGESNRCNNGIVIDKDTISNSFVSCHFEHNYYHAVIKEGSIGTSIIGSFFAAGSTNNLPKRFLVNSGIATGIFNSSSQDDPLVRTSGSNAPYQQNVNVLKSSLIVFGGNVPSFTQATFCYLLNNKCLTSSIKSGVTAREIN